MSTDPAEAAGTAEAPGTGEPAVDAALGELAQLDEIELAEQVAAYERIHDRLSAAINEPPGRPRSPGS